MAKTSFRLESSHRALIYLLIILVSASLVAYVIGGLLTSFMVTGAVLALLWLTKPLWAPEESPTKLYIGLITTVATASIGKTTMAKDLLVHTLLHLRLSRTSASAVAEKVSTSFPIVMFFVLVALYIIVVGTKDRSAMKVHPKHLDEDFPEERFNDQALRFVQILTARLALIDEETKWDDYFYSPLKAEVEIISAQSKRRKVVDLISALKSNKSTNVIVLLGDPGSGKSVALRKVSRELMKEFEVTGRIPVYVNLKEWSPAHAWTREQPPTSADFRAFLLSSLRGHSFFADQFLSTYFDKMVDGGRFFFLLDSFDEIPGVLDVNEDSWLIHHLSSILTDFFAQQTSGRGVLSSRFYRRPSLSRLQSVIFQIRPFSDLQIHDALLRSNLLKEETVTELFRNRVELIPVARNPFAAALIRSFAEQHGGGLPSNQLAMYDSYIQGRLTRSLRELETVALSPDDVIVGAVQIAWVMFEAEDVGLEVPISRLATLLPAVRVQEITSSLRYAGLARLSANADPKFSFVHRRLNEYFVASYLIAHPDSIALDSIPKDSRYRDALVLFCEVSDFSLASKIASFCWSEVRRVDAMMVNRTISERISAVHCLRFLRDGFRTRRECLPFSNELARFIERKVLSNHDLLEAKLALEGTGLLDEQASVRIINEALTLRNSWVSETCVNACRHMRALSEQLTKTLALYFWELPAVVFLKNNDEIMFSLSLSDGMKQVSRECQLRAFDLKLLLIGTACSLVVSPMLTGVIVLALFIAPLIFDARSTRRLERFTRLQAGVFATPPILATRKAFIRASPDIVEKFVHQHHYLEQSGRILHWFVSPLEFGSLARHPSLNVLAVFVLLAVMPTSEMLTLLYLRRRVGFLLMFYAAFPAAVMLYIYKYHYQWLPVLLKVAVILFASIMVPAVTFLVWVHSKRVLSLIRDHALLKEITRVKAISRKTVSVDFCALGSNMMRCRYVSWLKDQKPPSDDWPGERPNVRDDESSSMLAQLDEVWLGLAS